MNKLCIVSQESQNLEFKQKLLAIDACLDIIHISSLETLANSCAEHTRYLVCSDIKGVKALNIAAYIKDRCPGSEVALLSQDITDSLKYRASKAKIDQVLTDSEVLCSLSRTKKNCPYISFISPMGGSGVSTVAALLANISAEHGLSVGLIALNSSFSPLFQSLCAEKEEEIDLSNLARIKGEDLLELAKRIKRKLYLYDLARKPEELELVQNSYEHLLNEVGNLHNLLVLDLASVWSELSASCLKQSDRIIVVSEERSYTREQLLKTQNLLTCLEIEQSKVFYLINKSLRKQRDQSFLRSISEVLLPIISHPFV